jgi:hypothetical protein
MEQIKKPSNPKAFPIQNDTLLNCQGMDLRDYFANSAMQGFTTKYGTCLMNYDSRAKESYRIADAMLKQREL